MTSCQNTNMSQHIGLFHVPALSGQLGKGVRGKGQIGRLGAARHLVVVHKVKVVGLSERSQRSLDAQHRRPRTVADADHAHGERIAATVRRSQGVERAQLLVAARHQLAIGHDE